MRGGPSGRRSAAPAPTGQARSTARGPGAAGAATWGAPTEVRARATPSGDWPTAALPSPGTLPPKDGPSRTRDPG
eukprot:8983586-Alexandrium_andersonii.AAC.1